MFCLMGKFFKINIFNILTGQKQDMTELKLVWPVNTTGQHSKIILSPGTTVFALYTLYTYLSTVGLFVTACVYLYVCCRLSVNEKYSQPPFAFYLCWLLECLGVSILQLGTRDIHRKRNKMITSTCCAIAMAIVLLCYEKQTTSTYPLYFYKH